MAQTFRQKVFNLAWQLVKRNGYSRSDAFKTAWLNYRLVKAMRTRIVKFHFQKVDGVTLREAYGTLQPSMLPPSKGGDRRPNDTLQVYYDTEKQDYRCFKKANLVSIG